MKYASSSVVGRRSIGRSPIGLLVLRASSSRSAASIRSVSRAAVIMPDSLLLSALTRNLGQTFSTNSAESGYLLRAYSIQEDRKHASTPARRIGKGSAMLLRRSESLESTIRSSDITPQSAFERFQQQRRTFLTGAAT